MKIKFPGEQSIPEFRQALFEQSQLIEEEFLVRHIKYATLYFTPTDGFGREIFCMDRTGKKVDVIYCDRPYRCIADKYDN